MRVLRSHEWRLDSEDARAQAHTKYQKHDAHDPPYGLNGHFLQQAAALAKCTTAVMATAVSTGKKSPSPA